MKRIVLATALMALVVALSGCNKDRRTTDAKLATPSLQLANRPVMPCYECGAPQRPFRISSVQSFYRCSGQPPKFAAHSEVQWTHGIDRDQPR